jgi:NAD(P)-dependent dehydrogenase (short-subunit alcohol dehydrogenase family)
MAEFEGKLVLVTGAGRGAGRAVAQAFSDQGAILAVNDITPINLDETVALLKKSGGKVKDYVFDIAKRLPARALVEEVLEDWGRLDILVNHANVKPRASLLEMDEWDWQRTLDVNLSGVFYLMQSAGRAMREQGGGTIVNIGWTSGQAHGLDDRFAYLTSNSGLAGLSREAAREFAAYNIRVNMVCDGPSNASAALEAGQSEGLPISSCGPQAVARLVLYLCSQAAAHISGQAIPVQSSWLFGLDSIIGECHDKL